MSTISRASSRAISISSTWCSMGDAEAGRARLARAEHLAAAAQPQVLLGDAEAVLGLAHDAEAVAGDGAERRLVEEEADRRPVAPADAAAELVELGEAEALGVLDHHDRRVAARRRRPRPRWWRPGRGSRRRGSAPWPRSRSAGFMRPWTSPTIGPRAAVERSEAILGRRHVEHLGFLDQRADPIGLGAVRRRGADALDHLVEAVERQGARLDRPPAGRLLGELRDVHVAVVGEHERARDRRRGHDQHVGGAALGGERQALVDAEAMLLVDDDQGEVAEVDALLEERVGADEEVDRAAGEAGEDRARARGPSRGRSARRSRGPRRRRAARWCGRAGGRGARSAPSARPARPASMTVAAASSATTVLPEPTSPCSRRSMRSGRARSASISASAALLAAGQAEGQGGEELPPDAAVALPRRGRRSAAGARA